VRVVAEPALTLQGVFIMANGPDVANQEKTVANKGKSEGNQATADGLDSPDDGLCAVKVTDPMLRLSAGLLWRRDALHRRSEGGPAS
jgi:hypothetical protein